jgi:hypothetical protein
MNIGELLVSLEKAKDKMIAQEVPICKFGIFGSITNNPLRLFQNS